MQDGSDGNAEGISPRKDSPTGSSPTQNPSIGLENALQWADPETLTISDHNVRKTEVKGPRSTWEELVQSVKDHGVIVPPIVTPSGKVIVGQRRVLAAREAKVKSIQAKILSQEPPEDKAIALCMIENEHRDAIDPNDRLDALLRLQKIYKDNDKVAKAIGRSLYTVTAWLSVSSTREEVPNLLDVGTSSRVDETDSQAVTVYRDRPMAFATLSLSLYIFCSRKRASSLSFGSIASLCSFSIMHSAMALSSGGSCERIFAWMDLTLASLAASTRLWPTITFPEGVTIGGTMTPWSFTDCTSSS